MFVYALVYIVPAGIVWGAVALIVYPLTRVSQAMLFIAWTYALVFGFLEILIPSFRPISSTWQVPAQWLQGRPAFVQSLIWGMALGPGFVTRNPYAGFWLLPVLLTLSQHFFAAAGMGIAIGMAHGGARAYGILSSHRKVKNDVCGASILKQWRWRVADGLLLLFGCGFLIVSLMNILMPHLH